MINQTYKVAGTDNFEMASFQSGSRADFNPINMFKEDQTYNSSTQDMPYVIYDGIRLYTTSIWPIGDIVMEKEWLQAAFDETGAYGIGALLFAYHKDHKLMDYIPQYLSNPGFMSVHGEKVKATLTSFMSGHVRNDVMFRYQRLLQLFPIMFETMSWIDEYHQDLIGSKMYRFGIPDAFPFIKPENVTAEMIHEAIKNAKSNAAKRLVPPATPQFIEMYVQLLNHDGEGLVEANELVQIAMMDWRLAYSYIRKKELDFNTALSIIMTFVYKRGNDINPADNYTIIEKLYNDYGPSDQWPTLDNVLQHVNAMTGGKASLAKAQPQTVLAPANPTHADKYATKMGLFE